MSNHPGRPQTRPLPTTTVDPTAAQQPAPGRPAPQFDPLPLPLAVEYRECNGPAGPLLAVRVETINSEHTYFVAPPLAGELGDALTRFADKHNGPTLAAPPPSRLLLPR